MHGDHGKTSSSLNNKDVPRFAPNFTVYVLPPDAVCLFSEDRKFFLYGELYCKLAAAIGAGGLGEFIFRGLAMVNNQLILAGAIPAAVLALTADFGLGWLEKRLRPR